MNEEIFKITLSITDNTLYQIISIKKKIQIWVINVGL